MLKKRLVGVITVKNGWAVQSFGYRRYLPLGRPECLAENFDRWGADEILVQIIDRSATYSGPDFELVERLGKLGLSTPLIYAGGIRSTSDCVELVKLGADRIVVDSMLHDDLLSVKRISEKLGAQAVVASLPLSWCDKGLLWYDYRSHCSNPIPNEISDTIQKGFISEVLVIDWMHEGLQCGYDQKLVEEFPLRDMPIIAFGGITDADQIRKLLQCSRVEAFAVGNFLSYREHAIQAYKAAVADQNVRLPYYKPSN